MFYSSDCLPSRIPLPPRFHQAGFGLCLVIKVSNRIPFLTGSASPCKSTTHGRSYTGTNHNGFLVQAFRFSPFQSLINHGPIVRARKPNVYHQFP
jgi:hypothetical protein